VLATVLPLLCIALFRNSILSVDAHDGSELRGVISMVADSIATGDFESENLNMMGREPIHSNQFRRFVYLADSATTEELYALTHHKSPVVRCYAFDALAYRHPSGFLRTIDQEQGDTSKFRSRFFDVANFASVKEHLNESTVSIYRTVIPRIPWNTHPFAKWRQQSGSHMP
jgi:hypothetical protein